MCHFVFDEKFFSEFELVHCTIKCDSPIEFPISVKMPFDRETLVSRGFAYIGFDTDEAAKACVEYLKTQVN